jgi:aryl-alcohol dehydrogenase-like predicted oxidoreductase
MAWVIKNRDVSTAITGASNPEQLVDIVGAVEVQKLITKDVDAKIEELFKNKPLKAFDYHR